MPGTAGFAQRFRRAYKRFEERLPEDVTQAQFAEMVTEELRRAVPKGTPIGQGAVSKWLGGTMPSYETLAAVARLCAVPAGWLAFGETARDYERLGSTIPEIDFNPMPRDPAEGAELERELAEGGGTQRNGAAKGASPKRP